MDLQAGGGSLDAATLRSLADALLSGGPQPGVGTQAVDLAQSLLQSNPSADGLVRQLAQMQMQNQQVNYQQQVIMIIILITIMILIMMMMILTMVITTIIITKIIISRCSSLLRPIPNPRCKTFF